MHRLRSGIIVIVVLILLSVAAAAHVDYWGYNNPQAPLSPQDMPVNANLSGQVIDGSLLRRVPGQSIHGEQMKNTNSCASCHITHTASAGQLLFQSSVYNACITCHAGDYTPYDVVGGSLAGGRFYTSNLSNERKGVSYHLATGTRKVGDAPGALRGDDATMRYTRRGEATAGEWDKLFSCSSCHAPHGSYSDRLLHYNVNGQGKRDTQPIRALGEGKYRVVNSKANSPWLYYDPQNHPEYAVIVYRNEKDITEQFAINYGRGELDRVSGNSEPTHVSFVRPTRVTMQIKNNSVIHSGGVVDFCTACHIGYYDSVDGSTFAWHDRFYHQIDMDVSKWIDERAVANLNLEESAGGQKQLTCLTCHFAHGTDTALMRMRGGEWWNPASATWRLVRLDTEVPNDISTANLRFLNPGNDDEFSGRYESCYLCHQAVKLTPEVIETTPTDQEYGIGTGTAIEIIFDLKMAKASIVVLQGEDIAVEGTVSVEENIIKFEPTEELLPGQTYTVIVKDAKSRIGGALESLQFEFHTFMFIEEIAPRDEAEDVESDTAIQIIFSHDIDMEALSEADGDEFMVAYINEYGEFVMVEGVLRIEDNQLTFIASEGLPAGEIITVTVGEQFQNLSGVALQEPYQWFFTTKALP